MRRTWSRPFATGGLCGLCGLFADFGELCPAVGLRAPTHPPSHIPPPFSSSPLPRRDPQPSPQRSSRISFPRAFPRPGTSPVLARGRGGGCRFSVREWRTGLGYARPHYVVGINMSADLGPCAHEESYPECTVQTGSGSARIGPHSCHCDTLQRTQQLQNRGRFG